MPARPSPVSASEGDEVPAEDIWCLFLIGSGMALKLSDELELIGADAGPDDD